MKNSKKWVSILCLLLAFAVMIPLSACAQPGQASDTHTVIDHAGNSVEVPNKVERVVVCDIFPLPSVLSVFFDSAEKIVGMAPNSMSAAKNSLLGQLYPGILQAATSFMDGSNVNIEELLKLNPDVVFYSDSNPELGTKLRSAGLAALAVSASKWSYNCVETLNHWIELFSEIFPGNDKTKLVQDYSKKMYDLVQSRVSGLSDSERQRVFFLFGYSDSAITTSGASFFGQWWADAIGAVNVANELPNDNAVKVSMEQIYAWNPSLILITNFNSAQPEALYKNTVGSYNWSGVSAVKEEQVYKMPLGMYRSYTPGVDTPITLLWMAKAVYPDLFGDLDVTAECIEYYKEVFGVNLTSQQVESIFAPVSEAGSVVLN